MGPVSREDQRAALRPLRPAAGDPPPRPGAGLGLFIARSLAEAQGGQVSCRPVAGRWHHLHVHPPGRRRLVPDAHASSSTTTPTIGSCCGRLFERVGITAVFEAADGRRRARRRRERPRPRRARPRHARAVWHRRAPRAASRIAPGPVVVLSNHPRQLHGDDARRRGATGYVEKRVPARHLARADPRRRRLTETALEVVRADLPADVTSVRSARTLVREAIGDDGDDLLFALELLVSELVTNAVVHASAAPRIEAQLGPDTVRVAVYDDDPTLPARRLPDVERPGGRGLHLLDRLATRWGAEPSTTTARWCGSSSTG